MTGGMDLAGWFLAAAAVWALLVMAVTLLLCGGIARRDTQVPRDPRDGDLQVPAPHLDRRPRP